MSERARMRAIIHGRVQGVFFRDFTRTHAMRLSLLGCVRNLWNGSVEVVAEGDREALESLLKQLHIGPSSAWVEKIDLEWSETSGEFSSFEVRYR
ncbi:MAG: acylphosphatase [Anaerolineae bacterium]|nr:acylphosphatase [Anaerolineae bacterium]